MPDKIKALIIDDAQETLDLIKENINLNYEPLVEIDLEQTQNWNNPDLYKNEHYDMYIVDDVFYGVSRSLDIIKNIRKENKSVSIFILSGLAAKDTLKQLINMNIDGYIEKDTMDLNDFISRAEEIAQFKSKMKSLDLKIKRIMK